MLDAGCRIRPEVERSKRQTFKRPARPPDASFQKLTKIDPDISSFIGK
jgi:hypothetical protein